MRGWALPDGGLRGLGAAFSYVLQAASTLPPQCLRTGQEGGMGSRSCCYHPLGGPEPPPTTLRLIGHNLQPRAQGSTSWQSWPEPWPLPLPPSRPSQLDSSFRVSVYSGLAHSFVQRMGYLSHTPALAAGVRTLGILTRGFASLHVPALEWIA